MWEFIKQHWGNLASLLGLIITIFTLLFARRASQAAQAAKMAILQRNVADDLEEAERQAQEIILFLGEKDWRITKLKAGELRALAIWINTRWASLLGQESRIRVNDATAQLRIMIENLEEIADNNVSVKQRRKLLQTAERIRDIFLQERARFLARNE